MISAGDFRNGKTLEIEGTVYQILEFQHVKPGKGAAFVRTKLKDIKNGGVIEIFPSNREVPGGKN
jgi:elongation factor P